MNIYFALMHTVLQIYTKQLQSLSILSRKSTFVYNSENMNEKLTLRA